jgi:hypothetical protein
MQPVDGFIYDVCVGNVEERRSGTAWTSDVAFGPMHPRTWRVERRVAPRRHYTFTSSSHQLLTHAIANKNRHIF